MKQSHYYLGITLVILILAVLQSCAPGPVAFKTKKHTYYKGNYAHFEQRARVKAMRDSIANMEKLP